MRRIELETGMWAILFDDPDHTEVFVGAGAEAGARKRFEEAKLSWSCYLFVSVETAAGLVRDERRGRAQEPARETAKVWAKGEAAWRSEAGSQAGFAAGYRAAQAALADRLEGGKP